MPPVLRGVGRGATPGYRNPAIMLGAVLMLEHSRKPGGRLGPAAGFTLVELMITLAVAAVVMAIAVPNFTGLVNSTRLTTQANELVTGLQLARSEAIRLNRQVTFCGGADAAATTCAAAGNWGNWLVLRTATGEVLHSGPVNASVEVSSAAAALAFRADGLARTADGALANTSIRLCMPVSRPVDNIRQVSLAGGSRTSVASESGDGEC